MRSIYLPFQFNNGKVATTSDFDEIIKQKIIDVLAVTKTERPMRPRYGLGTYTFLYEPVDPLIWEDFKQDALVELREAVSGVRINDIVIAEGDGSRGEEEGSTIYVTVYYSINPSQKSSVTLTVSDILNEETYG
jgi:phage baseplate assembly protein W